MSSVLAFSMYNLCTPHDLTFGGNCVSFQHCIVFARTGRQCRVCRKTHIGFTGKLPKSLCSKSSECSPIVVFKHHMHQMMTELRKDIIQLSTGALEVVLFEPNKHYGLQRTPGSTGQNRKDHIDLPISAEQLAGDFHTDKCLIDRPTQKTA